MSGLNELPPPYSRPSMTPMSGSSTPSSTLTGTDGRTQQAAITALHPGPNPVPANAPSPSLAGRGIPPETVSEGPLTIDANLDDALENFTTSLCGEESLKSVDGPNSDPTLSILEHRQQSAAASAAHIFTETSLQLVPVRENSPETMIVVNDHPIFFQIGGSAVTVGNVTNANGEKAEQEVGAVLEEALQSPDVPELEKNKIRLARQESTVQKLTISETREGFAGIPAKRAQAQGQIAQRIPEAVRRMVGSSSPIDAKDKFKKSAEREAWGNVQAFIKNPDNPKQEVCAHIEVARTMFQEEFSKDKELLKREYASGRSFTKIRGRLISSTTTEQIEQLIEDIQNDDSLTQEQKKELIEAFRAGKYEKLSVYDLVYIARRKEQLLKEIGDWIVKRAQQLTEASKKEKNDRPSDIRTALSIALPHLRKRELNESVYVCVLAALGLRDLRRHARQEQKEFIKACMKHDNEFRAEMNRLDKKDREDRKENFKEIEKQTQVEEAVDRQEIVGQQQKERKNTLLTVTN